MAEPELSAPIALLERVRFFGRMSPAERAAVAALLRPLTFAPGEYLGRTDVAQPGLQVIESGLVELRIRLPGDTHQPVWEAGPGEVLGEISLASRQPFPISARALEPTRVWLLDARVVEGLRAQAAPLAFAVLGSMARTVCARVRFVLTRVIGSPSSDVAPPIQPGHQRAPIGAGELPLLRVLPLFRHVDADALAAEAACFERLAFPRGAPIYAEGEPASALYVVLRGAIETHVVRGGEKRRLGIAGPGRIFGEVAFVGGRPHLTSARAQENAIVLAIDVARLAGLVARRAPLALRLFDAIAFEANAVLGGAGRRQVKLIAEAATRPAPG
jgi:CRP-like cAMP-binding protein